MNSLIYSTEITAYFIWEYTQHGNAIDLWYCAEDIAFYLEQNEILSIESLERIIKSPRCEMTYIGFLRHIAYKVYIHTRKEDAVFNWFACEKLLFNLEWCSFVIALANAYRKMRIQRTFSADLIRTQWIKKQLISNQSN